MKHLLPGKPGTEPLAEALRACRPHFVWAAVFSAFVNLLYLTPTLYMLQVYDRVVPTGGLMTLVLVTVVALLALAALAALALTWPWCLKPWAAAWWLSRLWAR